MPVAGSLGHPEIVVIGQESLAKILRVWEGKKDEKGEVVGWCDRLKQFDIAFEEWAGLG